MDGFVGGCAFWGAQYVCISDMWLVVMVAAASIGVLMGARGG